MKKFGVFIIIALAIVLALWFFRSKSAAAGNIGKSSDGRKTISISGKTYYVSSAGDDIMVLCRSVSGKQSNSWVMVEDLDRWLFPVGDWEGVPVT